MSNIHYEEFENSFKTTLNGSITNVGTSLVFNDAVPTKLKITGINWRIIIDDEIMLVTDGNAGTNTVTVVRGQEGTTAVTHGNGALVLHELTKGSIKRVSERRMPFGTLPRGKIRSAPTLENVTVAHGALKNLIHLTGQNGGFVSHWYIAINCTEVAGKEQSLIKIYIDGEGSPSVSIPISTLHGAVFGPITFYSRYVGSNAGSGGRAYTANFAIPFNTEIKIDLVSAAVSADCQVYSLIEYHTGVPLDWDRQLRFKADNQDTSGIAAYTQQDLCNISGRGKLLGIYMCMNPSITSFTYLEGNIKFYIDGDSYPSSPGIEWPGTEDYFLNGDYFNGGTFFSPHLATTVRDNTAKTTAAFRFHIDDPIEFDTSLRITWNAGDASEAGGFAGTVRLFSTVWYYLDG